MTAKEPVIGRIVITVTSAQDLFTGDERELLEQRISDVSEKSEKTKLRTEYIESLSALTDVVRSRQLDAVMIRVASASALVGTELREYHRAASASKHWILNK